jgi:hypothetical protein
VSHNILSGNVSTPANTSVELSGSFTGDGADLANVSHATHDNADVRRVPYYGSSVISGDRGFRATDQFEFNEGTNTLTTKTGSFHSIVATGLSSGSAAGGGSYLALNSLNQVVLTASSGGGDGTIGPAEDGDYTDGLFTDFTTSTLIGVPVDRFNEVLKILAPSPAPNVNEIDEDVTDGVTAKLSFGSSFPVAGYTSSATAAGFDAVDRSGSYSAATSGSNIRLGVYDGTQDIEGQINPSVAQSVTNGNLHLQTMPLVVQPKVL